MSRTRFLCLHTFYFFPVVTPISQQPVNNFVPKHDNQLQSPVSRNCAFYLYLILILQVNNQEYVVFYD